MYDLPGAGVLVAARKGVFLVRSINGATNLEQLIKINQGYFNNSYDLPE